MHGHDPQLLFAPPLARRPRARARGNDALDLTSPEHTDGQGEPHERWLRTGRLRAVRGGLDPDQARGFLAAVAGQLARGGMGNRDSAWDEAPVT
ncbi:MAG: hypothetical protein P1V81_10965 [Planctomycetota bacterium]|nr:hypothetical protein [Planctomycetota bacterium]